MHDFYQVTLGGLLGSSIATALLGALFLRRNKRVESEIKAHFDEGFKVFESQRLWKEQLLSELLGPMVMQFERTKRAFNRWNRKSLYLEASIVRAGNLAIINLLLVKGHLIPSYLMEDATRLVEHYDAWLEEFDRLRGQPTSENTEDFVFVGPQGYGFPRDAEVHFKEEFQKLQHDLYGV